jgi:hypothetical protein
MVGMHAGLAIQAYDETLMFSSEGGLGGYLLSGRYLLAYVCKSTLEGGVSFKGTVSPDHKSFEVLSIKSP